jgi:hypothetical protein
MLFSSLPRNVWRPTTEQEIGWSQVGEVERELYSLREVLEEALVPLAYYCYAFGVQQQWNTFAPTPPKRYANYTVVVRGSAGELTTWTDGLALNRYGAGLFYNPTIKLVSMFGLPLVEFQEAFLASQVQRYIEILGVNPGSVTLLSSWVNLRIAEGWKVQKDGPYTTVVIERSLR